MTVVLVGLGVTAFQPASAEGEYRYIVYLTDKAGSPFGVNDGALFLSQRALERRARYNIPVDELDLPLSTVYLDDLQDDGHILLGQSHWLNAVLVESDLPPGDFDLSDKSYVRKVVWAFQSLLGGRQERPTDYLCIADREEMQREVLDIRSAIMWQSERPIDYGYSGGQVRMLNGQFLHNNGWTGRDMLIAVLDAGFTKASQLEAFQSLHIEERVAATYDFVDYDTEVYESSGHGTSVLGAMAARLDGLYLGTAPDASYLLLRTEDIGSEQLVEEFNYVLGLEYADRMGADVTNTSLGYTRYNHQEMNHTTDELDGDHPIASIGGDVAASRGMIVVNSAGNEGNSSWQYISFPADGDSIFAVGSVNRDRQRSAFSGKGHPDAGNIKPNVMAQGEDVAVFNTNGELVLSNGTSFSAPILAGLAACLWQAFPGKTNMEILDAIEQSSSRFLDPDLEMGYGIPDFQAAYALLYQKEYESAFLRDINVFPNPFSSNITLTLPESPDQDMDIQLVNDIGQVLFEQMIDSGSRKTINLHFSGVSGLLTGLYFLKIKTTEEVLVFKLIKV